MTDKVIKYKQEQYQIRVSIDGYECQCCGLPYGQLAHRLSQSKINLQVYGHEIIHHNFNIVCVCGLQCNDWFNIGASPIREARLIELIQTRGDERLTTEYINKYIGFRCD